MGILATFREVFGLIGLKSISISELAKNRPPFITATVQSVAFSLPSNHLCKFKINIFEKC